MYLQVPEYPVFLGTALALPEGLQPEHFQPETNNSTLSISLYVYIYTPSSLPLYYNICMCIYIYPDTLYFQNRPKRSCSPNTRQTLKEPESPDPLPSKATRSSWHGAPRSMRRGRSPRSVFKSERLFSEFGACRNHRIGGGRSTYMLRRSMLRLRGFGAFGAF